MGQIEYGYDEYGYGTSQPELIEVEESSLVADGVIAHAERRTTRVVNTGASVVVNIGTTKAVFVEDVAEYGIPKKS